MAVIEMSSDGMKRRINIPAGLLQDPKVIYMDEPTVGIDPQSLGASSIPSSDCANSAA